MTQQTQTEQPTRAGFAESQICPNCGMRKEDWQGNGGYGYELEGQLYCCRGCAHNTGCNCR